MSSKEFHRISNFFTQDLRREMFLLGGRHRGDVLGGAIAELESPRLSQERRVLLRAIVAKLSPNGSSDSGPTSSQYLDYVVASLLGITLVLGCWLLLF